MTPEQRKIALFVTSDLVGLLVLNGLVPKLLKLGLYPVIFDAGLNTNRKPMKPKPVDIGFYTTALMAKTLLPYLDKHEENFAVANFSYKQLAKKYNCEYRQVQFINAPELVEEIRTGDYVGGLSVRQYQVFEKPMIEAARAKGFLWNIHGGILPDYKGMLAPYYAIANGEKDYGWTLHEVDAGIDTGAIIDICRLPLDPAKPILNTYLDLVQPNVEMIERCLGRYLSGDTHGLFKANQGGRYYSYPSAQEMEAFQKRGVRYLESPKAYVDQLVSYFSVPGSRHAAGLRNELILAISDYFRPFMDTDQAFIFADPIPQAFKDKAKAA